MYCTNVCPPSGFIHSFLSLAMHNKNSVTAKAVSTQKAALHMVSTSGQLDTEAAVVYRQRTVHPIDIQQFSLHPAMKRTDGRLRPHP